MSVARCSGPDPGALFDLAAERLGTVQREHGRDAVAMYLGNPNVHNYGSLLYGPALFKALRTRHRYSATSYPWPSTASTIAAKVGIEDKPINTSAMIGSAVTHHPP